MKFCIVPLSVFILLCTSTLCAQEASRADFKKFLSDIEGRWVGDVTWITDWPGLGKKGDKVTGYYEGRLSEDGNLLIGKFFGGSGSESQMAFYDAAKKRIRWIMVDSGGSISDCIIYQADGNWVSENDVTLGDGTKGKLKSVGEITDDGNTWTWLANGKIGDDEIKDQKDIWRRVSK